MRRRAKGSVLLEKPSGRGRLDISAYNFCEAIELIRENDSSFESPTILAKMLDVSESDLTYWCQNGHPTAEVWRIIETHCEKIRSEIKAVESFNERSFGENLTEEENYENFKFSNDYRAIYFKSEKIFDLSPKQAEIIAELHLCYKDGKKFLHESELCRNVLTEGELEKMASRSTKWRIDKDAFKNHKIWKTLLNKDRGKVYLDFLWTPDYFGKVSQYTEEKGTNDNVIIGSFRERKRSSETLKLEIPPILVDKMEFQVGVSYKAIDSLKDGKLTGFSGPIMESDLWYYCSSTRAHFGKKSFKVNGIKVLKHLNKELSDFRTEKWSNILNPGDLKKVSQETTTEMLNKVSRAMFNMREGLLDQIAMRNPRDLKPNPVKVKELEFCRDYPKTLHGESLSETLRQSVSRDLGHHDEQTSYGDKSGRQYSWKCHNLENGSANINIKLYDKELYWRLEVRSVYSGQEMNELSDLHDFLQAEKIWASNFLDSVHKKFKDGISLPSKNGLMTSLKATKI